MSKFVRKLEGRFPDLPEFFRWDTHRYMSLFLSACLSVHPLCTIFFRNHCDHNFWYTCVKWWYLQVVFFFFIFVLIYFFGLLGGGGEQGRKYPKMKNKNCICHALYLRNSLVYDRLIMIFGTFLTYIQAFFSFLQNCFFCVVIGLKGHKMV